MASKEVADLTLRVLDGTEEFHLVAGVVRDGGGVVTNHGNSRRGTLAGLLAYITANVPAGGISQAFADGRYLQKANNLSDVGSVATARGNLSVYSIAQVDALVAAAGGNWWKGFVPTAASLATIIKTSGASNPTAVDDANVGLIYDAVDWTAGSVFKSFNQATPSDAADWTVTVRLTPDLPTVSSNMLALFLTEVNAGNGAFPLAFIWGPCNQAGNALVGTTYFASGGFIANHLSRPVVDPTQPIWLRIRWVVASNAYFFDWSRDGKKWQNSGNKTKAQIGFISRATHIGIGSLTSATAQTVWPVGSCDYFRVT
jgi:hypothetical protein